MAENAGGWLLTDDAHARLEKAIHAQIENSASKRLTDRKLGILTGLSPNTAANLYYRRSGLNKSSISGAYAKLDIPFDSEADVFDLSNEERKKVSTNPRKNQDFAELRKNYLDFLIRKHSTVDPRGIMQTERGINLPLDEVYVSLTAEKRAMHVRESLMHGEREGEYVDAEGREIERWQKQEHSVRSVPVELDEALRQHARLIFLGDPGAGKTTLLRYLALKFAQAVQQGIAEVTDNDGDIYGVAKLPILVRVSEFADAFTKDRALSVRDFLPRCHCGDLGIPEAELKAFYEAELSAGNALILLDGLDEVVSAADRAEIGRRIDSFVTGLAGSGGGNRVIVTSRIMGYREAALSAQFEEHTLRDMSIEQIERFLMRWCPAYEKHRDPNGAESERQKRAEEEAKALLDAIKANEGVKRLATNPLLLTILALIHRNGSHLPKRRVELYRIASETLLRDWQIGRGIQEEHLVQPEEARELLAPLAYWMHCHEPTGLIEEREARDVLTRVVMRTRGLKTKHEAEKFVTDFLRRVREHTGIFVERAPGKYGFMHLTFEEYFAALYLVDDEEDDEVIKRIQNLKHHPRWEEPIRLAMAQEKPKKAAKFIRKGIFGIESDYEKWLNRDLLFGGRCVSDCVIVSDLHSLMEEIGNKLLPLIWITEQTPGYCDSLRARVWEMLPKLESDSVVSARVKLCSDKDEEVRYVAASALGKLGKADRDILAFLYNMLETWVGNPDSVWDGLYASAIVIRTKEVEAWMAEQEVV